MKAVAELTGVAVASWILSLALLGCVAHHDPPLCVPNGGVDAPRGLSLSGSSVAFRDPETGRLVEPTREQSEVRAAGDVAEGLRLGIREEPGRTAAGGVRVRLQGSFATELIAVRGEDGTIRIVDAEEPAGPALESENEP